MIDSIFLNIINICACIVTFIGTYELRKPKQTTNQLLINTLYSIGSILFLIFFLFQGLYWNALLYIGLAAFGIEGIKNNRKKEKI